MRFVIITLYIIVLGLLFGACSNPVAPSRPLGPPQVVKDIHGLYYANPGVELPPGVTIDPVTGGMIYPRREVPMK